MAPTGEEIRQRLTRFAARWSVYEGSERAEAQTFLNELFSCYGQDREAVGARFEHFQAGGFVDLLWPTVCVIEMKAPGEARRLAKHRAQALRYWSESADSEKNVPAPRYVVLCAFRHLEVWEPGAYPSEPRAVLDLIDLPDQYDVLLFLAGDEPVFAGGQAAVTREAVAEVSDLYARLRERRAGDLDVLRDFVLQAVWCMFAEDLGQLPAHRFSHIVEQLIAAPRRSSADELGQLFRYLDDPSPQRPTRGIYAGTPYANGSLFAQPAAIHLATDELELLRRACAFNWREVEPSIFGSLLEGGLGHEKQWELGAHYTHEADIQKVVQPTIVAPWRERIENLETHAQAKAAQSDLLGYVVLDPACGSGNFLYVAYRELRRLERRLHQREAELRRVAGLKGSEQGALSLFFPLANVRGIEIDAFAVSLARVTLWMGHKLAVDELELSEATLPLANLSGIRAGDALRMPWPRADAIIGNPPFHGSQNLRRVLGNAYVEWLAREFKCGIKDLCVYWFRKAHDHLEPGRRAGLVGTNSVSQNRARGASLEYIVERGGVITDAVSKQKWPGEAVVNVSIVNWMRAPESPPTRFMLDGEEVAGISPSLRTAGRDSSGPKRLPANHRRSFQGPIPAGPFYLDGDEAEALLGRSDSHYEEVVRPYLIGEDIAEHPAQRPSRQIIDFGMRSLEDAMSFPAALDLVRTRVKPIRDRNNRESYRRLWWRFAEPRPAMRAALAPLSRYVAGLAQGKRIVFCWCEPHTCPSNLTNVFAFEDDYAMGVLSSRIHGEWAKAQSSTLRIDIRYTPTSAFETFPWPEPSEPQREVIAELSRHIITRRQAICRERDIGLTTLYNQVGEGAWTDLRALHGALDDAVARAYGWPAASARDADETNRRLLELNRAIASGQRPYSPFAPPTRSPETISADTPSWVTSEAEAERWMLCVGIAAKAAGIPPEAVATTPEARFFAKALFDSDASTHDGT